jgi:AcrR family transcriptional regulator
VVKKVTKRDKTSGAAAQRPTLFDGSELDETRTKILDAAFRQLAERGYAALSVREIGKEAGVNHALVNYYFGTKDKLVIEVLDAANRRLLERQQKMYASEGGFAEKWAAARRFYQEDLRSGFVRVQAELLAASFSNAELREKVLPRVEAWKAVVLGGVREALKTLDSCGVSLPPVFTADAIACFISEFWLGMEISNLLGSDPESGEHRRALDAMEQLLGRIDEIAREHGREPATPKRTTTSRHRRNK